MIARILKTYRIETGMTQEQLAEALHVTQQTVSCYETGRRVPTVAVKKRIKDLTGCPAETLIPEPRQRPSA